MTIYEQEVPFIGYMDEEYPEWWEHQNKLLLPEEVAPFISPIVTDLFPHSTASGTNTWELQSEVDGKKYEFQGKKSSNNTYNYGAVDSELFHALLQYICLSNFQQPNIYFEQLLAKQIGNLNLAPRFEILASVRRMTEINFTMPHHPEVSFSIGEIKSKNGVQCLNFSREILKSTVDYEINYDLRVHGKLRYPLSRRIYRKICEEKIILDVKIPIRALAIELGIFTCNFRNPDDQSLPHWGQMHKTLKLPLQELQQNNILREMEYSHNNKEPYIIFYK